jgi:glycosyltransferase involved in cell wall biosynthesis
MRMGFADTYFDRFQTESVDIEQPVNENLELAVIIPAYNEPDIEDTLIGLLHNTDPDCHVDVILVFNAPEDKDEDIINRNLTDFQHYSEFAKSLEHPFIQVHVLWQLFPKKIAGPGSARKYGMDIALQRFNSINNPKGIIVSLDADAVVSRNYLTSIRAHFANFPMDDAATIYFEHQYQDADDPVVLYELYLRYFRHALQWSGYPHHFYSIGSCFAVKAKAYADQGGMNRKNAGEDFYFLNKIVLNGKLGECNTPTVYPSGRVSDRVPFGTGQEVKKIREEGGYDVYSLKIVEVLAELVRILNASYSMTESDFLQKINMLPKSAQSHLSKVFLWDAVIEARENSSDEESYLKRLYRYFDTFKVIRLFNYLSENSFPKEDVAIVAANLADCLNIIYEDYSEESLLIAFRQYDKNGDKV